MNEAIPPSERIDRRRFACHLAVAASALGAVAGAAQQTTTDDKTSVDEKDPDKPQESKARATPPPEELLLLTLLVQRYPSDHFDEAAVRGVYNDVRGDLARSRMLSEFPLKNSDAPSFVFRPYHAPD